MPTLAIEALQAITGINIILSFRGVLLMCRIERFKNNLVFILSCNVKYMVCTYVCSLWFSLYFCPSVVDGSVLFMLIVLGWSTWPRGMAPLGNWAKADQDPRGLALEGSKYFC